MLLLTKMTLHHLPEHLQSNQLLLSLELDFLTDRTYLKGECTLEGFLSVSTLDEEGEEFLITRPIRLWAWQPAWCEFIIPPFGEQSGHLTVRMKDSKEKVRLAVRKCPNDSLLRGAPHRSPPLLGVAEPAAPRSEML